MTFRQSNSSIVEGQEVPFPPVQPAPDEPLRLRLRTGGRLQLDETHCKRRTVNFSQDGRQNITFPHLSLRPSTIRSPGRDPGIGVFTREDLDAWTIVTEYGGFSRTRSEVQELHRTFQHTHVKSIVPHLEYLDSRWVDHDVYAGAEIPSVRCYLEGHYLGGLANSAFMKVIIIEFS